MITYRFSFPDGRRIEFEVRLDRKSGAEGGGEDHPTWVLLEFHRCPHCPLAAGSLDCCPVAADLAPVVRGFRDVVSHSEVLVEVFTPERAYSKKCDVQTGLRSLIGLIMAASACPYFLPFKSQAATHLPFATLEETLLRSVGSYLLRQHFIRSDGGTPDYALQGLQRTYDDLRVLNRAFGQRLAAASEQDANLNALYSLMCVTEGVSASLEEQLRDIRQFFMPEEEGR